MGWVQDIFWPTNVHVLQIQHEFGLGVNQARGTDMYCGNDRVYKVWRAWRKWVLRIHTCLKWSGWLWGAWKFFSNHCQSPWYICALKRFESEKISISVGVDFGTGVSVHAAVSEAHSMVGDGIGWGGRGGPRGAVKFGLVVQLTTCGCWRLFVEARSQAPYYWSSVFSVPPLSVHSE